jgi:cell wall-associated NlpC family hydrolase
VLRRVTTTRRVITAVLCTCVTITSGALALGIQPSAATATLGAKGGSAAHVAAQIHSAEHRVHVLNVRVEAASEAYDAARERLVTAQQAATTAQQGLRASQARVDALQATITAFAVAAYRGDTLNPMLTLTNTGSAAAMVARMSTIQAVSQGLASVLVQVAAARRTEEQAQATSAAALSAQRTDLTAVQADRTRILATAREQQHILATLQVRERAIIRAAKAAKAKAALIAARKREAALAARREAERRAAQRLRSAPTTPPAPPTPVAGSGGAKVAVQWAYKELGKPYVWAAAGPNSFDCSGLTMYVWGKAGVSLDHYTGDQWHEGTHVSRSQLEPGDLVFFAYNVHNPSTIHHVGIYVGNGSMIDAPYTGTVVKVESMNRPDYIGAVRPG